MKVGDMVKIKECHSAPELVGREAKVIVQVDPEMGKYPFQVVLTGDPIKVGTPFGEVEMKGPFPFREDELEPLTQSDVPDVFKNM